MDLRLRAAWAALLLLGAAAAQDPPSNADLLAKLQDKKQQLAEARAETIRPVTINGKTLSPDQVRREAIFLVGAKQVEGKIAEFFIQEQIEEAIANGRPAEDFEIPDEEVIAGVKDTIEQFQRENPDVEFWDAVRAQYGLSKDQFLHQNRQTKLFDRVFFPGPASNWPLITREAIMASAASGGGKSFWDNLAKASVDDDGEPRELPALWMYLCRQWVQKQLKQWSDIKYPADGLPPEVCLSVNGRTLETAEAFEEIKAGLYTQDLERAMAEVVIREALRQELEKSGHYLDDDQFYADYEEYREPYDKTPFTVEVIATSFKGYPSLEAFRQRWRLIRSYERMIEKDINDDNLQAHADKFAAFFSDGQVNVDVVQFFARDLTTGAWMPDGMDAAKARAEKAMQDLENGASFDDVLAQRGEFYATDKEKGRLGSKSLNQLRQALRENEFTDLLHGYSIGNHLFYEAEPGTIVGPLQGPDAWFIARVNSRTPPRAKVNIGEERTRELVKQDYVAYRFLQWANEVLARTSIE